VIKDSQHAVDMAVIECVGYGPDSTEDGMDIPRDISEEIRDYEADADSDIHLFQ